jgi:hypothetical protein
MKKIITILLISFFLSSCGNDRKEISLTFVFDKPINNSTKYPEYFEEITTPFTSECSGNTTDVLMKPINVCRLDISNKEVETNAWHFKDMGDNTVDFSTLWLKQYYKDSLITPYITQSSVKDASIESWLNDNKDSVYIFTEDSDIKLFKGKQVFRNTKELNSKIKEIACSNLSGRIVILVNPRMKKVIPVKIAGGTGSGSIKHHGHTDDETPPPPPLTSKWTGDKRTVDEMKSGTLTKKELNGNNQ